MILSTSRRRGLFFTTREFESIRVSSTSSARGAPRIAPPKVWRLGLDVDRATLPSVTHATHFARSRAFPPSGPPRSHMPAIDFGTILAVERDRRRRGDPRVGGGTHPPPPRNRSFDSRIPVYGHQYPLHTRVFRRFSNVIPRAVLALLGSARSRRDTSFGAEREQFDVRGSVRNVRAVAVASRHRPGSWRRGRARRPLGSGETIPEYKGLPPARLPRPSR